MSHPPQGVGPEGVIHETWNRPELMRRSKGSGLLNLADGETSVWGESFVGPLVKM